MKSLPYNGPKSAVSLTLVQRYSVAQKIIQGLCYTKKKICKVCEESIIMAYATHEVI